MSGARGRLTVKADPSPRTLDAASRPPIVSVRALASGSPIPVPSIGVSSAPSLSKGMKMRSRSSGCMPGPVSETVTLTWPAAAAWLVIVMVPPRGCT